MKIHQLADIDGFTRSEASAYEAAWEQWQQAKPHVEATCDLARRGMANDHPDRVDKFMRRARSRGGTAALRTLEQGDRRQWAARMHPELGQERHVGSSDLLSFEFLEAGLLAGRSVSRVRTPLETGTGFLVGHDVLLTNHHVLKTIDLAEGSSVEFDVEDNRVGPAKRVESYSLDPERFFVSDAEHDFCFVAVVPESDSGVPLANYGSLPLKAELGKILVGHRVNIIQHPLGEEKQIAIRDNRLVHLDEEGPFCLYLADTDTGSSGAPVFNDDWEVIALHCRSVPKANDARELLDVEGNVLKDAEVKADPGKIVWVSNKGLRVSRLVHAFEAAQLETPQEAIRAELVKMWKRGAIADFGSESNPQLQGRRQLPPQAALTIPIEIRLSIREG